MLKPTLLLVEDEEDDVFFFKRTLEKSGASFSIHRASNGAEAIEFIRKCASTDLLPQIIFLDLKMPVLNGFDFLDWLQKQNLASAIPTVVLSGSEQQKDIDRARQLGATDYLVKPIRVFDLNRVLRDVLGFTGVVPVTAGVKP
ncbi:MAG TPA: response regulator [Verrucomicrobiae bacterium]|jgi:CheY-like chemotaxis protein|nr:response regulator [Verrucomicrobiae bacterium]